MSYCRFSEGDVYAYECEGGVQFWTAKEGLNRLCNTFNEAYQYAMFLRDGYGLDVPSYAIEALKEDALEESKRISGASGVIGELQAENDKLELENAKLRDAMYTNAGKHALQHMDEDELRIWATQQSEYIDKLRELVGILCYCMQFDADCDGCKMNGEDGKFTFDATCACDGLREMLRELGVEVGDVN